MRIAIGRVALLSVLLVGDAGCGAAGDGARTVRLRGDVPVPTSPAIGASGAKGIGASLAALSASDAVKVVLSSRSRTTVARSSTGSLGRRAGARTDGDVEPRPATARPRVDLEDGRWNDVGDNHTTSYQHPWGTGASRATPRVVNRCAMIDGEEHGS